MLGSQEAGSELLRDMGGVRQVLREEDLGVRGRRGARKARLRPLSPGQAQLKGKGAEPAGSELLVTRPGV